MRLMYEVYTFDVHHAIPGGRLGGEGCGGFATLGNSPGMFPREPPQGNGVLLILGVTEPSVCNACCSGIPRRTNTG